MNKKAEKIRAYFLDYVNFNSDLNKQYLNEKGMEAVYFDDVNNLMAMANVAQPDVIVYNIDLRKDDLSFYYTLHNKFPNIPIIVMSSSKTISKARKLLSEGAFMNLRSPINMEEMFHIINRAVDYYSKTGEKQPEPEINENPVLPILEKLVDNSNELLDTFEQSFPEKITVSNDLLLQKLIEMISEIVGVEIISLLLIDPFTNKLIITAQKGLPEIAKQNPRLKVGEGIAGYVAKTGQPILTTDINNFKHLKNADYGKQYKSGSFISLPLKVGHRVVGVLNVNNKKDGSSFTQEDLAILELLNVQILLALRNAQLLYDQRNQIKTSKVLNEIDQMIIQEENQEKIFASLLEKCRDMMDCETLLLFMIDQNSSDDKLYIRSFLSVKGPLRSNVTVPVGEGIEGMVMNVQKPVLISNAEHDSRIAEELRSAIPGSIHNIAAYPIIMFDKVVGIIEAINKIHRPQFEREDLYLLKQITYKIFLAFMKNNLTREKASLNARLQAFLNRAQPGKSTH